jgi:type I restriction enzyme S subunit
MSEEWSEMKWGDLITLEYGKSLKDYREGKGDYRVYGSNGPIGWSSKKLSKGPGVILGRKGATRGVEYSDIDFWVIDTAYYARPLVELNMKWLYYAMIGYKLGDINDGSPILSTPRNFVYKGSLKLPPLPEQKAIDKKPSPIF